MCLKVFLNFYHGPAGLPRPKSSFTSSCFKRGWSLLNEDLLVCYTLEIWGIAVIVLKISVVLWWKIERLGKSLNFHGLGVLSGCEFIQMFLKTSTNMPLSLQVLLSPTGHTQAGYPPAAIHPQQAPIMATGHPMHINQHLPSTGHPPPLLPTFQVCFLKSLSHWSIYYASRLR